MSNSAHTNGLSCCWFSNNTSLPPIPWEFMCKECKNKRKSWRFDPIGDSKVQTKPKHPQPLIFHFKPHRTQFLTKSTLKDKPTRKLRENAEKSIIYKKIEK